MRQPVRPGVFFVKSTVVEDPENLGLDMFLEARRGGETVGADNQAVIVPVFTDIIHNGLVVGAGASQNVYFAAGLLERDGFALDNRIELDDVDFLNAVFKETVYQPEKAAQAVGGNGTAYINRHQQPRGKIMPAAHILKSVAAVGAHTGKPAFGA